MIPNAELTPITQSQYLHHIEQAAAFLRTNYDQKLLEWRENFNSDDILARDYPRFTFVSATFEAFLFQLTGKTLHAQPAKKALLQLREIIEWYPSAFGPYRKHDSYGYWKTVPAVPPEAYACLKGTEVLSSEEEQLVEGWLAEYAERFFEVHEWGAHNRALWVTRDFARIIQLLPEHPSNQRWKKKCLHLLKTSWGNWSIEDAQIYLPLWLSKMMHIADILEIPGLFKEYNMLYYLNYFLHLMAPHGMVTDFGDARWQECWHWYLTCFERGAKEYQNEEFKWAAARIYETKARSAQPEEIEIDFPFLYQCCDDSIGIQPPSASSRMVLDELAGKKIVFRNGWEPESSFLMLNYKGDQDYGRCDRDYLRQSINVIAEKMHHGHTDENAICLLMSQGSVLLNDAGYRVTLTNGQYRADFYHNRLSIRNEPPNPTEPLLNSLHKRAWYHPTRTEKIHFFNYEKWDYSRTRVKRAEEGWEWDRAIIYLKVEDIFVIIDRVLVLKDCFLNVNNLFHTQQLLNVGDNWFDTRFNDIAGWKNPTNRRLLVWFLPQVGMKVSCEELQRNHALNRTMYQSLSSDFQTGDIIPFVTILIPHSPDQKCEDLIARIKELPCSLFPKGVGIMLVTATGPLHICFKCDLEMDLIKEEIRPKYNYQLGKLNFGNIIETDARLLLLEENKAAVHYGFAEASKIHFKNQLIFEVPSLQPSIYHPNGDFLHLSQPRWDWWEDQAKITD